MVSDRCIDRLLGRAVELGASDLHLHVGAQPVARVQGRFIRIDDVPLSPEDTRAMSQQVMGDTQMARVFEEAGETDLAYSISGVGRFRVSCFRQRGSVGLVARVVPCGVPDLESLGLPPVVRELSQRSRGLILVTGPTGSGKSTTLAAMCHAINMEREAHIITLEDPIEYLHSNQKGIVTQRELGTDTRSFAGALRAALRQDPDVILVGEMRDLETMEIAVTAAETGHLVLSTVHTGSAAGAVDRIIDVFPSHRQAQIRLQLSVCLRGVITQFLVGRVDGAGRVPAVEVLVATPAVGNLIREGKTFQIPSLLQTGGRHGMVTMEASLKRLHLSGTISEEELQRHLSGTNLAGEERG